ncbi:MAG: sulfotransferase, partial [Chloroflexi bacterium]|nr:sulfotransferase [Chloroflexota bacterium]
MENRFSQLKSDPIFILGAARSGTTWVYDIFTAHPQVAGVFESWLFTRDNGLGSLFTEAHWPPKYSGLGRLLARDDVLAYAQQIAQNIMSNAIESEHRFLVE